MTARLRPGGPGYLDGIPPFDLGISPTTPDGTVAMLAPGMVPVGVAVAVAERETQDRVARLLEAIAVERYGRGAA